MPKRRNSIEAQTPSQAPEVLVSFAQGRWLEHLLDDTVLELAELTSPWSRQTTTWRVTLARQGPVAVQVSVAARRGSISRRIVVQRAIGGWPNGPRVPEVIAGDAGHDPPFVVSRWIEGHAGSACLRTAVGARSVAEALGDGAARLAAIPVDGIELRRRWADPVALATDAGRWVLKVGRQLERETMARVEAAMDGLHGLTWDRPVVAHGDMAPVNVLQGPDDRATLIDFEDATVAHPLHDLATVRAIMLLHHREIWRTMTPALWQAAAVSIDERTEHDLAVLGCLQWLERSCAALGRGSTAGVNELSRLAALDARRLR